MKTSHDYAQNMQKMAEWLLSRDTLRALRNVLCRLIRPAEYECDPLLSAEEEKDLA